MSYKPHSNCLKFIMGAVFLLLLQFSYGQRDFSGIDGTADSRKNLFGGKVSVMVWKDTVVYQKSTGDMTTTTQGNIGAGGAWLTAALTMVFVEQGKISLDDPVAKYLPIFSKYAKSYLTVRHCLANTTGLGFEKGGIFQKSKYASLEEQVNSFASSREIVHNPGEAFDYNNIGTNIAGRVLEVVGKKSFDRLMLEKIFRPLGMKKSSYASENLVDPFSGAMSTPADYLKFLSMLLNKGTGNGKKILSEESISEMMKIQTGNATIGFVPKGLQGYQYGLGNWIGESGTEIYICPGISGGWYYINTKKRYACVIFGESKEKKEKDDKSINVYKEIMEELEEIM